MDLDTCSLCHTLHGSPSKSQASLSTMQSQSTNDVLDAVETQRVFVVHRTMNIQPEEHPNSTSINELRRKFENNVQRRPLRNSNRAKMRNHAPVAGISDTSNDDELEFIRIGRLLRRKPVQLEEINHTHHKYPKENEHIDSKFVSIHGTTDSLKSRSTVLQKVPFIHRISEVPNLSSNASIVADNCYASQTIDECPHSDSLDLITPPDPESSRQRTGSVPAVSVCTLDLSLPNDKSPPPEEPRPPQDFVIYGGNDYTPKPHVQDFRVSAFPYFVPPQVTSHNNDNTGVKEIQGLLNKFQRSRNERHLQRMKDSAAAEFALVSGKEPAKYNQKVLYSAPVLS
ncbi:hypothetical protein NECAME_08989 [Necator americanus]|uniref:Uncharacterized protein n=1 Tax=Necator americanus TaxID=51031 RepID=W2TG02_NECAM|nr:hypothetical protein NECAME_08989 [Necator americanus]ETN80748.1 hypothetical protein NECAME_08989 [Necator americanus]